MTSKFTELAIDCADPGGLARFWCSVLDYEVEDEDDGILPTQRATSSASLRAAAPDRRPHTAPDLLPVADPRSREHAEKPLQRWRIPTRARSNSANFLTHDTLNEALSFVGLGIGPDGKLSTGKAAQTLSQAEQRARSRRQELLRRRAHAEVLRFCRVELLQDNYFHAVLEAAKSIAARLRTMTGSNLDGVKLVDQVLELGATGMPVLAFNALVTETDRSEHRGLVLVIKGVFGAFRNLAAHEAKILRPIGEQDATDLLTTISLLHRKLDGAVRTGKSI